MTVLITGGAGFIGSHVTEALLARGDRVVVVDDFNDFYEPARKERNLASALASPLFQLVRGDLRSPGLLEKSLAAHAVDIVVHLAASVGVRSSINHARAYIQGNVEGAQAVLDACAAAGVKRLVLASSSSVYGSAFGRPSVETSAADRPLSPYAASKRAAELLAFAAHHLHGIEVTCLRFFTAVGPRQRPDLAVHRFARQIFKGEPVTMFGDGSSERDYTHVLDIVDGVVAAVDKPLGYRILNLGAGAPVRLDAVVEAVGRHLELSPKVTRLPAQKEDVESTMADLTEARRQLGYAPRRSFDDAVRDLCGWMVSEGLLR